MHYYKRNLGDYAKKAGRLSMLQHGSYTLLIDACYDREQFPTLEQAIEWTWADTNEEVAAVQFVLNRFFVLENGVYVQKRIQEEIAEYHQKAETNSRIATERETKRAEKRTNRERTVNDSSPEQHEPPPNQEPRTINHKLTTLLDKSSDVPVSKDEPKAFDTFWTAYPRKIGKGAAEKSWTRQKLNPLLTDILQAVKRQSQSEQWRRDGGQFIPHPSTWLNEKRWQDGETVIASVTRPNPTCVCCGSAASREESGNWYCSQHDKYSQREAA